MSDDHARNDPPMRASAPESSPPRRSIVQVRRIVSPHRRSMAAFFRVVTGKGRSADQALSPRFGLSISWSGKRNFVGRDWRAISAAECGRTAGIRFADRDTPH